MLGSGHRDPPWTELFQTHRLYMLTRIHSQAALIGRAQEAGGTVG